MAWIACYSAVQFLSAEWGLPVQIREDWVITQASGMANKSQLPEWLYGAPRTLLRSLATARHLGNGSNLLGNSPDTSTGQADPIAGPILWSALKEELDAMDISAGHLEAPLAVLSLWTRFRHCCFGLQMNFAGTQRATIVAQLYKLGLRIMGVFDANQTRLCFWPTYVLQIIKPLAVILLHLLSSVDGIDLDVGPLLEAISTAHRLLLKRVVFPNDRYHRYAKNVAITAKDALDRRSKGSGNYNHETLATVKRIRGQHMVDNNNETGGISNCNSYPEWLPETALYDPASAQLPDQFIYGYPIDPFVDECRRMPDGSFIIMDAGSTDSGPQKVCFNALTSSREGYLHDLRPVLMIAHERRFKVLIGSSGGHGTNEHVAHFVDVINQICREEGYSFKIATILAEVPIDLIKSHIKAGTCTPCGPVPELTADEVEKCPRVLAQMGYEPFLEALNGGAEIIIGGRAYDPSMYTAACIPRGVDPGIAWHMGKICERGALCATPRGKSIRATLRKSSFDLTPVNPLESCTPTSVAANTLYEKSRPDLLPGPGGILDVSNASFVSVNDRTTRISGAVFVPQRYTVKIEGAKPLGYRSIVVGGTKDPNLIRQIDEYLGYVRKSGLAMVDDYDPDVDKLNWHVYGKNGVMGRLETNAATAHELFIIAEVLSSSQQRAKMIANRTRPAMLHTPYPGQMANSGNLAFPFAPFEQELGPFSEFNVYHIIPVDDPLALFPIKHFEFSFASKTNGLVNGHANGKVEKKKPDAYTLVAREIATWCKSVPLKPNFTELINSGRPSAKLGEIARIVRSKNSGPFEATFDIFFNERPEYEWVKNSGLLNPANLSKFYNLDPKKVVTCIFNEPAIAFKFTIPRPVVQGGFGETDMHAAQQYMPIAGIEVPLPKSA
ncbi:hypothetical protein M409DRAFT_29014 [Zasmidium cellare ATCC 36951]|uniref:Uncharacterized protein n=1 Tax=Zasmidium cellare ATCC 36951 TaxID=1080233 RepID=A0A6A6C5G5_ZASCE|nr:uncharacterized protein M409DRAFT_29014 [Zasmidium cellare ATCC 36951]KAF2160626.1 hypothetical protein M409DRAFT_29014 [Zasmidium cellare ATCC 36951]